MRRYRVGRIPYAPQEFALPPIAALRLWPIPANDLPGSDTRRSQMMNDLRGVNPRRGLGALFSFGLPASELACAAPGDGDRSAAASPEISQECQDSAQKSAGLGHPLGGWPKRLTDIAIATAGLFLAAPLMILVALLIKLTERGPVLFAHGRIGFQGQPFRCYKFRTMVTDGDALLAAYLAANPTAVVEWQSTQKLRNDPRVSFLGQVLRKSSIDELPQLFNILRGDMSCVGPRPVIRAELARYGSAVGYYLRTRPGLTGLWQVTGRSSSEYESRVLLDTQYVQGWSLWVDFVILCRTPVALTRISQVS